MPELPMALDVSTLTTIDNMKEPDDAGDLPIMQEWAFDIDTGQFLTDENGQYYLVSGNAALKIWLYWAVTTQRYRWIANSTDYGVETERMIGLLVSDAIKSSELERTIREAIEICPYVKQIYYINLSSDDDLVVVDVAVKSPYGEGWVVLSVKI